MLFNYQLAKRIFYGSVVGGVVITLLLYQSLPDMIAVHFGFSGESPRTSSKEFFLYSNTILLLFMAGLFILIDWQMPKMPDSLYNLPHKDFWMGSNKRSMTISYNLSISMWIGSVKNIFLVSMTYQVYHANMLPKPKIGPEFSILLILYLFLITYIVIKMYKFFNNIEENEN